MHGTEQRQAKLLAISHGVMLGGIFAGVATALTFLVFVALDVRSVAVTLLVPAAEAVVIFTASIVYMYKRRGF